MKGHPTLTRKDFLGDHEWCFYGWREGAAHRFFGPQNIRDVWNFTRCAVGKAHSAASVTIGEGLRIEAADGDCLDVLPPAVADNLPSIECPASGLAIYGTGVPSDVWMVKKINPQSMVHLTEKPAKLARLAMMYSSRVGENVLDLFGGSGSTLIAAEQTKRKAFLMEMDMLYCDVIRKRWAEFVHGAGCDWEQLTPSK